MKQVFSWLDKILCIVLAFLILIMLSVGTLQVVYRYILQHSLSWSEELLRYLYVWVTMLGISMGIRRKGLACISSFTDFVERKSRISRHVLAGISFALQFILFYALTYYGTKLCITSFHQLSPALRISMGLVYLAMPVGGVLALLYSADEVGGYIKMTGGRKH